VGCESRERGLRITRPDSDTCDVPAPAEAAVKTVIVADDTAFVRDRFRDALHAAGHRASAVADASELLARVRSERSTIDLVVLDLRLPSMQGIGYGHFAAVIRGRSTPARAVNLMKRDTKRYAKRQWTWFAREPEIRWVDVQVAGGIEGAAELVGKLIVQGELLS